MKWLRLYSSVLHDPKVQMLPPALFKGWVNLLCLANESEPRGVLPDTETIAWALHMTAEEAVTLLETLQATGLIDTCDDGLSPHNWNGRQAPSDDVNTRVSQWRAQKRNTPSPTPTPKRRNVTRNKNVTAPEEKRRDIEEKRETRVRARDSFSSQNKEVTQAEADPEAERSADVAIFTAWCSATGRDVKMFSERRTWMGKIHELRISEGLSPPGVPPLIAQYRAKFGNDKNPSPGQVVGVYSQLGPMLNGTYPSGATPARKAAHSAATAEEKEAASRAAYLAKTAVVREFAGGNLPTG
jgi:hypothetical protein